MNQADDNLMGARIALLRRVSAELPLATTSSRGEPLRWRVRESEPDARHALLVLWREALDTLHRQGFGTDGAIAASRFVAPGRVAFDPERVWPLGTRVGARPVAAWLDYRELQEWLDEAGHTGESPFARVGSAWSGANAISGDDSAGAQVTVVAGPTDEVIAIATARGLSACRADELEVNGGPAWGAAIEILAQRGTLVVASGSAARTRIIPTEKTSLRVAGRILALSDDERAIFGLKAGSSQTSSDVGAGALSAQRAIEDSQLIADRRERLRTRAQLLTAGQTVGATTGHRSLSSAVDLARDAGDRATLIATLMRRAAIRWLSDPSAALQDATEARRLASTVDDAAKMAAASALEALVAAIARNRVRLPPSQRDPDRPPDPPEVRALDALTRAAVDGVWRLPNDAVRALNLAILAAPLELQTLVVELVSVEALAFGTDLDAERCLGTIATSTTSAAPLLHNHCLAWLALFAARRGATLTATDHLVRLGDAASLEPRTATIALIAARSNAMDAIASRLTPTAPGQDVASRVAGGLAPDVEAPLGWWVLHAELSVTRRDAEARRSLQGIEAQASPWLEGQPDPRDPLGLLVAVGTLLASLSETRARGPLYRALGTGLLPEHLEIRALGALALVTPPDSEDGRAITARLAAFPNFSVDRQQAAPLPLTPHEATERVLDALRSLTEALVRPDVARDGEEPALEALETLLGPVDEPRQMAGAVAKRLLQSDTLTANEALGGAIALSAWLDDDDGAQIHTRLTFDGPAQLSALTVSALLAAIRPLLCAHPVISASGAHGPGLIPRRPPTDRDWRNDPAALDRALRSGAVPFFPDVRGAFNRHELTQETVRGALKIALSHTSGVYKTVAARWLVGDYRRFMDFLRRNSCLEDFRLYRA